MQKTHVIDPPSDGPPQSVHRKILHWLFHRWFLLTRAMTLGVRAVVLDADGRVLLVEHTYVPGWHLPGGGVEIGEALADALIKELKEEAGITLTGAARLHGIFQNSRASRRDHVAVYVVRDFAWNGPPAPNREIKAANFFALSDLPASTSPAVHRRLSEVLDGTPIVATW
jgi:ADP-ribose pyrophosphatase YjhB (NUDIX family)